MGYHQLTEVLFWIVFQKIFWIRLQQIGTVSDSFVDFLKTTRETQTVVKPRQKRKAVNVVPGKGVTYADLEVGEQPSTSNISADTSNANNLGRKRQRISVARSPSSSESENNFSLRDSSCSPYNVMDEIEDIENIPPYQSESRTLRQLMNGTGSSSEEEVDSRPGKYQEGDYVILNYE